MSDLADSLPAVYGELRRLAAAKMAGERPDHTLDATALVHEAWLHLQGRRSFESRSHFFRVAAEAMRRILVDHARARGAVKRGRDWKRVPEGDLAADFADARLLDLDEALDRLAAEDPMAKSVVELHHFAGLPHEQAAEALGITVYLARLKWEFARAWLKSELDFP
ncbi:MAG TPA: ECF-type sigma factor [Planctomycetia bacterium]|nr:ECF-type sigma factor [Planctomycetia bacterium]